MEFIPFPIYTRGSMHHSMCMRGDGLHVLPSGCLLEKDSTLKQDRVRNMKPTTLQLLEGGVGTRHLVPKYSTKQIVLSLRV
jgi:hypothetical protein